MDASRPIHKVDCNLSCSNRLMVSKSFVSHSMVAYPPFVTAVRSDILIMMTRPDDGRDLRSYNQPRETKLFESTTIVDMVALRGFM